MYGDLTNDSTDLNYYATAGDPVYFITNDSSPRITNCNIRSGLFYGIYILHNYGSPKFDNLNIYDNGNNGKNMENGEETVNGKEW